MMEKSILQGPEKRLFLKIRKAARYVEIHFSSIVLRSIFVCAYSSLVVCLPRKGRPGSDDPWKNSDSSPESKKCGPLLDVLEKTPRTPPRIFLWWCFFRRKFVKALHKGILWDNRFPPTVGAGLLSDCAMYLSILIIYPSKIQLKVEWKG